MVKVGKGTDFFRSIPVFEVEHGLASAGVESLIKNHGTDESVDGVLDFVIGQKNGLVFNQANEIHQDTGSMGPMGTLLKSCP